MQLINRLFIVLIKIYRRFISPLFPATCRFYPTCSEYALQAFTKHNFFKGLALTIIRLAKCNPLHSGGYDPLR